MTGLWVPHDIRDNIVDYTRYIRNLTGLTAKFLYNTIGIPKSTYCWCSRYGHVNEHNALVPRDHWLEEWEKQAIIAYSFDHPLEGYRRLTFMMIDNDVVAVSPSSTYRVLKSADLINRWNKKETKKGKGFKQPLRPHQHWHIDISHIKIAGTFYYLCSVLDGCSRYIVHWEMRECMTEADVEVVLQRAKEKFPEAKPRLISDNGSQFTAKDFKEFIRIAGMTHVKASVNYPQSNGKKERWYRTLKHEAIRRLVPLSLNEARKVVGEFVQYYNDVRLHSAIGYVPPLARLEGNHREILIERDRKLEEARLLRKEKRQALHLAMTSHENAVPDSVNS